MQHLDDRLDCEGRMSQFYTEMRATLSEQVTERERQRATKQHSAQLLTSGRHPAAYERGGVELKYVCLCLSAPSYLGCGWPRNEYKKLATRSKVKPSGSGCPFASHRYESELKR